MTLAVLARSRDVTRFDSLSAFQEETTDRDTVQWVRDQFLLSTSAPHFENRGMPTSVDMAKNCKTFWKNLRKITTCLYLPRISTYAEILWTKRPRRIVLFSRRRRGTKLNRFSDDRFRSADKRFQRRQ
ncbi:hypothetical protein AVEN_247136-1 [Araneus ventricosus]|uniref:Uncharacterized protein n=1 Tax=Araneus ventricosus TaxID=182803 RepID=A0A4Y2URU5_ARAVE|nr:hypothetical protein AVEN_247136-1 [Araneus ventricosus]